MNISRQLIELTGGRLGLDSEPGKGTEFFFEIDFERETLNPMRPLDVPQSLQGLSILVVNDNATNRFILEEVLTAWDMEVACADGAEVALRRLTEAASENKPIQLVLLDMMMPDVNGLMLARQIQQDPRLRGTPLILLSSSATLENPECQADLGLVGQVRKPVKQAELLQQIMRCFDAAEGRRHGVQPSGSPSPTPATRPLRVLLVEDGVVNQKVAAGLLKRRGHQVAIAENGKLAVAAAADNSFDVILMDIEMPEMDGLEATAAIRRVEPAGRRVPIIAMTAHAIKGDRERFLQAGMDNYISKPVDPDRLYELLEDLGNATSPTGGEPG